METIVLKLGGGAITRKAENQRRVRVEVVRRLAGELRRAVEERPARILAVHGAGPFGHSVVAEYGLEAGVTTARHLEGVARTRASMQDLSKQLSDLFLEEGCLVFPLQPSACLVKRGRRLETFFTEPVARLLSLDPPLVPLLCGDLVLDLELGASVVSGDELVAELGARFGAARLLLGTDVAGVFSADPKLDASARPLPRVDRGNLEEALRGAAGATGVDVTRGMRGKLLALQGALEGREALVFDLTEEGSLYRALTGREVRGTTVCL